MAKILGSVFSMRDEMLKCWELEEYCRKPEIQLNLEAKIGRNRLEPQKCLPRNLSPLLRSRLKHPCSLLLLVARRSARVVERRDDVASEVLPRSPGGTAAAAAAAAAVAAVAAAIPPPTATAQL